jgi:hypothetical protein
MRRVRFQTALVAHRRGPSGSCVRAFDQSTMSTRALQIATGLLAIIPVAAGLLGLLSVEDRSTWRLVCHALSFSILTFDSFPVFGSGSASPYFG